MAPLKKKSKKKDLKKLKKKTKTVNVVPIEPRPIESDWWDSFLHKISSSPGLTIHSDEEEAFKFFFRVSKKTFEYICSLVREDLISRPPSGLINIEGRLLSVEKQVAIAMRRLASGDSQVSVGASFGVGQSTVSQVTWRFIESLEVRAKHHIKWPDQDRLEEIKTKFQSLFGLPNCCGAVDATHVLMTLPAVQTSDDWCDQANNYSMLLQGIVDDEMRFLDVVTGWPGAMSVSRFLKCSGFYKLCENGVRLSKKLRLDDVEIREYIVGGVYYPLHPWLMIPYENQDSTLMNSKYKEAHEAARYLAVRALSYLKGSWRILSKVMWRPDKSKLPSIILACCLLHNIMIDCGDKLLSDIAIPGHHDLGYEEQSCKLVDTSGGTMRDNLATYLQPR
ncbi:protein ANTAGONIST OF LIKE HETEROCHROMATIN PROTEIN 1-like isoform X2 [Chenopodium quinoa]|uniref:protein ANTAGONIST OF LIKE HETEROCHROMATIN PROTEIN 1-like isoform X2 n=1 Tax=Chenopodium quinoa TaxID=63459 RepID=UPI000B779747|nr:protein ANTAGONIST OF LIKE HETEROCHROMATIN PROTEIN 1-like isoform X2 [Chenopodium quinoa]